MIALTLGALIGLPPLSARAWEVGVITTWIRGTRPQGGTATAHGGSLLVQQDLCPYVDIGARCGYMRSDCFKTYYVPVELTTSLKYPLLEDRLVPFIGVIGAYHIFTSSTLDIEDDFGVSPMVGGYWRFGKKKQWSLYIEGRWQFLQTNIEGDGHARYDGPGGSGGITFRF